MRKRYRTETPDVCRLKNENNFIIVHKSILEVKNSKPWPDLYKKLNTFIIQEILEYLNFTEIKYLHCSLKNKRISSEGLLKTARLTTSLFFI